jgi:hypothetical protein
VGTVADIVTAAFRRLNVIESNAVPSPEDMADGFLRFKSMLGLWRRQRLTIPFTARVTWPLSATKGGSATPYTVGVGGDINTPAPTQGNDLQWFFQDLATAPPQEYPLWPLTDDYYQAIPQKDLTAPFPQQAYYKATYAGGLGSLYLWPVATRANLQGVLYTPSGLQDPAATSSTLVVPDGYDLPLMDNLARVMWPEWRENVPIDPELRASAIEGLGWLKTNNVRMADLGLDPMWSFQDAGSYDINSDTGR